MANFKHTDTERLSPERAAERLVDLAYALTARGPVELSMAGKRISLPVAAELVLVSASEANAGHVKLNFELSWSTDVPAKRRAA